MLTYPHIGHLMIRMDEALLYRRFGELVRSYRHRLSLSQVELGTAIGLTRASIANIEKGRQRIPLHHLFRLAAALKVEAALLLPRRLSPAGAEPEIKSAMKLTQREQDQIARVVGSMRFGTHLETE